MLVMTMKRLQMNLTFLGYDTGGIDGIKGTKTKKAINDYRVSRGLGASEIADQKMIDCIRAEIIEIQKKIGANPDGVAGNETITKKAEYDKKSESYSWDNVKYFKKSEFNCPCCNKNNIQLEVVRIADEIREHFGEKCHVNSGTRCEKHNKEVKGEPNSRHLIGKAIDIWIEGISGGTLLAYTKQLVSQGKLRYTYRISKNGNAVHIDIK